MKHAIDKNVLNNLRYLRLFETAQDGILILEHPRGIIVDANPFICNLLGYSKNNLLGKKLWEIGFIEDKDKALKIFDDLIDKGYIRYENIDLRKSDGQLMPVEFVCNSYMVKDEKVIQCNIRDISDRVKKEGIEKDLDILKIKNLHSIIDCLSAIIDARDPFTAGHQFRVADFAVQIARYLKFTEFQIMGVHLASILHDIGKFKIPLEILVNPQKLLPEEYNLIKLHAKIGADILSTLDFEHDVVRFVREHHERLDGSGYPYGLKGDQISMEARIIAVADVMESITSFRPYRPALGLREALKEIMINQPRLYDSEVVNAAVHLVINQDYVFPPSNIAQKVFAEKNK